MLEVFKSELKPRVEAIEKRMNEMLADMEDIQNNIRKLLESSMVDDTPINDKQSIDIDQRLNSIEKKLLMGKYAPK